VRLAQGRLEQLMAYADGELPEHERGEVETLLSTNEDARQFLAELGHLGGLVRTT
jgi:anti-sigma factor RsiW